MNSLMKDCCCKRKNIIMEVILKPSPFEQRHIYFKEYNRQAVTPGNYVSQSHFSDSVPYAVSSYEREYPNTNMFVILLLTSTEILFSP